MTTRRLAAILAADVVGFSKLIGEDESGTLAALQEIRKDIVNPVLAEHGGRVFKLMGDGMLAEFPSAVQALRAALGIQERLHQRNAEAPSGRRIEVRIGVHQGDVVVEGTDLLGDGVNIASRLEALAEPGGICISARVHEDAAGKIVLDAHDMGEQSLKNIARPVRAYRISASAPPGMAKTDGGRPALPLPDKPSLAVLPFQNMSGDPEQEYFADGMVEEIITALSRVRSFFVIARNSSFTYKGKVVDVKQVGRELGVRYVLEGSVRKAGARVRITGQLVDANTGHHLWADRFEGSLDDVFDLQDRVTESVVGAVEPKLRRSEIERAARKRPDTLTAYDLVLRAWPHIWAMSPERNSAALDLLERAIQIDPNYAYAYALSAECVRYRINLEWPLWRPNQTQQCVEFAVKAISLDNEDPAVLRWTAGVLAHLSREYTYALELLERSLSINANAAGAWSQKGWVKMWMSHQEDSLPDFEKALRLSPYDQMRFIFLAGMGESHARRNRNEAAVEWLLKAMRENPNWTASLRSLAAAYARLGKSKEARAVAERILQHNPGFTITQWRQFTPAVGVNRETLAEGLRLAGLPE
jgi:adenylate cyclase